MFFSYSSLNIFGGGGWFLKNHGDIGTHAFRMSIVQAVLAGILVFLLILAQVAKPNDSKGVQNSTNVFMMLAVAVGFAVGLLCMLNILVSLASFQFAK